MHAVICTYRFLNTYTFRGFNLGSPVVARALVQQSCQLQIWHDSISRLLTTLHKRVHYKHFQYITFTEELHRLALACLATWVMQYACCCMQHAACRMLRHALGVFHSSCILHRAHTWCILIHEVRCGMYHAQCVMIPDCCPMHDASSGSEHVPMFSV